VELSVLDGGDVPLDGGDVPLDTKKEDPMMMTGASNHLSWLINRSRSHTLSNFVVSSYLLCALASSLFFCSTATSTLRLFHLKSHGCEEDCFDAFREGEGGSFSQVEPHVTKIFHLIFCRFILLMANGSFFVLSDGVYASSVVHDDVITL